ncbi:MULTISPECIES: single-stranded DNA-binding protein [Brevibacillus]|jgi:single-strand DNA-binding protein|uniref:Single-stranded DNA-binding protein n=1 Tax=Brevibacillus parabrevis TaxID=54914 RepID=A0A4Y3PQM9_BREPA|nr:MULTISPECIES: single-stranded DNA-binding protein [Brevibacillus]TGV30412.1 single-stranded DNA-binding protein [Mesorhizobium sp. M00.F.Ca.ET.186.01.1.1]KZE39376.1 single-stranded DNA-binding protein [Brevibacillus parabrevis]MBU8713192.1 single-stranded DNA-binding protein [Brevibacillus parabrevis]MDH6351518.1 single-strand DNA-binding protein [Brevibacillus sp. 1238]MDR4997381.1 single-stranded DNA-binding protein [Brevibacillus parabrevis]
MNKVILIGNLTKDPELRYTPNGVAVATFTVAINRPRTNQAGEREADFINIVAWQKLADLCASYLRKGRQAAIEGRLQTRSYDNKEGKRVYVTEVVAENVQFLGGRGNEGGGDNAGYDPGPGFGGGNKPSGQRNNDFDPFGDPFASAGKPINISDDDLPF